MAECPYIDRSFTPNPLFNIPISYRIETGGEYVFYDHNDGFNKWTRVQFCKLCGRKRDVFECLNESEWRVCSHFMLAEAGK